MGFFYGEAKRVTDWSVSTFEALEYLSDNDVVEEVGGTYRYYCYVLADFDPIKAREIYGNASLEEVTEALLAKHIYNKPRDGKSSRS